ncbi:hypothetical protein QWZ13_11815 [Reinekea marina]|nr:hypothetical protein [Reinekea marina]MDN3649603.1 hypothetical protein [Reinekea marina]
MKLRIQLQNRMTIFIASGVLELLTLYLSKCVLAHIEVGPDLSGF